jgi:hypothetical protein
MIYLKMIHTGMSMIRSPTSMIIASVSLPLADKVLVGLKVAQNRSTASRMASTAGAVAVLTA